MDNTLLKYFNLLMLPKRKAGVHFIGFFEDSSSF